MTERFAFRFDDRYRSPLRLLGVRHDRAEARVGPQGLQVRFGPWFVSTELDNIDEVSVAGPHDPWKAIGPHVSLSDRGLTFGTNADRTVCITFRRRVTGADPFGFLRHPNLSVSVAEPDVFAQHLRELLPRT